MVPRRALRVGLCAGVLAGALACRAPEPLLIGDGVARPHGGPNLDSLVQQAIDALPSGRRVVVTQWGAPEGMEILRAMEGAELFARMPGLIGVVGHGGSRDAMLAAAVYNARGIPQLVPTGTSRRLARVGPWTFPLAPNDSVEGDFLAAYAVDSLHAGRIAVFYVGDEYGIGLRDGIRASLRARGRAPVDETMVPNRQCGSEFLRELQAYPATAAVRRARPDVVVLAVASAAARCLVDATLHERPGTWILGGDGVQLDGPELSGLGADARRLLRGVTFWVPGRDAASLALEGRFRRLLSRPPTAAEALSYDGMMLLATAVREGNATRAQVRRWIESLGRSREAFRGVTGPISFDHGRVGARLYMVSPAERPE